MGHDGWDLKQSFGHECEIRHRVSSELNQGLAKGSGPCLGGYRCR